MLMMGDTDMDVFLEKIVSRKKTWSDFIIMGLLFTVCFFLSIFLLFIFRVAILIDMVLFYGLYKLIKTRSIEYEYAVTNGELDIDKIIAKGKRKRVFSANCKDFDIIARISNEKFNEVKNISNRIEAISSKDSPDIYFFTVHYKGEKTLVLFEPDERMIKSFKVYIPKKVFDQ
jgi:hypothetical protein